MHHKINKTSFFNARHKEMHRRSFTLSLALNLKDKMPLWQRMRSPNYVLAHANKGTRCSNNLVQAQTTLWLQRNVVIKGGKCSSRDSQPPFLSDLQDSLLGLVVFDLAPVTGGFIFAN